MVAIKDICQGYFKNHLDQIQQLAAKGASDKSLIENWPEISPMLDCFKGLMGKSDDKRVQNIIRQYDQMEERMNDLSDGKLKKMQKDMVEPPQKHDAKFRYI